MKTKPTKIAVNQPTAALSFNAFASLAALDTSALPIGTEPPIESKKTPEPGREQLVLRREKKDRGGKTVVVISGWKCPAPMLEEVVRGLRKKLGCGGTVEEREVVLQGDRPAEVASVLRGLGHQVRGVVD
jgi:translation initiation factor 1